jgi:hypothetical protein
MEGIFECPGDDPSSRRIERISAHLVDQDDVELHQAMALHRLSWRDCMAASIDGAALPLSCNV